MLDSKDIQIIKNILNESLQPIKDDIRLLKDDNIIIKNDIRLLKGELAQLKDQVTTISNTLNLETNNIETELKSANELADDLDRTSFQQSLDFRRAEYRASEEYKMRIDAENICISHSIYR